MREDALFEIRFFVHGTPQPGGSKRAFVNRKTGRAIVVEDCKRNKEWRSLVAEAALSHIESLGEDITNQLPFMGPVSLSVAFIMPRPKYHYTPKGLQSSKHCKWHTSKPDRTKLLRSTEDALTNARLFWKDDTQAVTGYVSKSYTDDNYKYPGALIVLEFLREGDSK